MKNLRVMALLMMMGMMLLTACADNTDNGVLPTRVELPADVPADNPPPDAVSIAPQDAQGGAPTLPATWTQTPTSTQTDTPTVTPSSTITDTPSPTPSITSTPTVTPTETFVNAPLMSFLDLVSSVTNLPPTYALPPDYSPFPTPISFPTPATACTVLPAGGFGTALQADAGLAALLGCPSSGVVVVQAATQPFERGVMVWMNEGGGGIYVFRNDGTFQRYPDTFVAGQDPDSGGEIPPGGLIEPVRGFGKVWRTMMGVRDSVGWGVQPEAGDNATYQDFANGRMIFLPTRGNILALTYAGSPNNGSWRMVLGTY